MNSYDLPACRARRQLIINPRFSCWLDHTRNCLQVENTERREQSLRYRKRKPDNRLYLVNLLVHPWTLKRRHRPPPPLSTSLSITRFTIDSKLFFYGRRKRGKKKKEVILLFVQYLSQFHSPANSKGEAGFFDSGSLEWKYYVRPYFSKVSQPIVHSWFKQSTWKGFDYSRWFASSILTGALTTLFRPFFFLSMAKSFFFLLKFHPPYASSSFYNSCHVSVDS